MQEEEEEEDGYSDDDLDDLPSNTLQQLQQDAIRSTQKAAALDRPHLPANTHSEGLVGGNEFAKLPQASYSHQVNPHGPSSDYGDFEDDEMLDGEVYDAAQDPPAAITQGNPYRGQVMGESTQRETWRQERFSVPQPHRQSLNPSAGGLAPPPPTPPPAGAR